MGGSAVSSDNESGNNWVMASVWGASENFSVIEKCLCRLALQISKSMFPCVNVNVRSRLSRAVRSLSISFKIYFWALLCRPSLDTLHWSRQEGNNWTRPRLFRFSCQSQVMESSFNFFYTIWTALNPPTTMFFLETLQTAQVECWIPISRLKTLVLMLTSRTKKRPLKYQGLKMNCLVCSTNIQQSLVLLHFVPSSPWRKRMHAIG